jgi:hypothetical protein
LGSCGLAAAHGLFGIVLSAAASQAQRAKIEATAENEPAAAGSAARVAEILGAWSPCGGITASLAWVYAPAAKRAFPFCDGISAAAGGHFRRSIQKLPESGIVRHFHKLQPIPPALFLMLSPVRLPG